MKTDHENTTHIHATRHFHYRVFGLTATLQYQVNQVMNQSILSRPCNIGHVLLSSAFFTCASRLASQLCILMQVLSIFLNVKLTFVDVVSACKCEVNLILVI